MRERISLSACVISGLITCLVAWFLPRMIFSLKGTGGGPTYLPVLVVFLALLAGLGSALGGALGAGTWSAAGRIALSSLLASVASYAAAAVALGPGWGVVYAGAAIVAFTGAGILLEVLGSDRLHALPLSLAAGVAVLIGGAFVLDAAARGLVESPEKIAPFSATGALSIALAGAAAFAIVKWVLGWKEPVTGRVFFSSLLVGLSTFGTVAFIVGLLPSLYYYATAENDMEKIWPGVPAHLVSFKPDKPTPVPGWFRPELKEKEAERTSAWAAEWARMERGRLEIFYRGLPESKAGVPWYNRAFPYSEIEPSMGDFGEILDKPLKDASIPAKLVPRSFKGREIDGERWWSVWDTWRGPFFWWMTFLALVYGAQFCMAGIIRKQWVEHEQLIFPHAEAVRDAISPPRPGLLRSHYFWIGAGVCGVVYALEGLHNFYPSFPRIELFGSPLHQLSLAEVFSQHPWSSLKKILSVQPYVICIAWLLPTQLSFSVWFFAIADNVIRLFSAYARMPGAWHHAINYYWINSGSDQTGAVIVLVAFLVWMSRRELVRIFRRALYDPEPVDADEFIPYRLCVFGFIASTLGILAWCVYAGMNIFISAFLFGIFYMILIFTSRLVSELGLMSASAKYFTPHLLFMKLFGYNHQTMLNTFAVNTFIWSPLIYSGTHTCPVVLTGFKLTGSAKSGRKLFALSLFIVAVATAAICFWGTVKYAYVNGALNTQRETYYSATKWIFENTFLRDIVFRDRSHAPDPTEITAMVIGGIVMAALLIMRGLFYWWPLHPLGYVALSIDGIWFSFFLGWLAKRTVLKYGGGRALPKATEFFFGLFAGQFFMAGFWYIVGAIRLDASFSFM